MRETKTQVNDCKKPTLQESLIFRAELKWQTAETLRELQDFSDRIVFRFTVMWLIAVAYIVLDKFGN